MLNRLTMVTFFSLLGAVQSFGADGVLVSFRLTKQKTTHFDDVSSAKRQLDTLRKLGCKVRQEAHGDHYDVLYSAPSWRKLKSKSTKQSDQWAHWLERSGFEVIHLNPSSSQHLEIVEYRLPKAKSIHEDSSKQADIQVDTLKMLGCSVKQHAHAGHVDISYHCDKWKTVGFEDHDAAHKWQKWLDSRGFETRHEHGKQAKKPTSRR